MPSLRWVDQYTVIERDELTDGRLARLSFVICCNITQVYSIDVCFDAPDTATVWIGCRGARAVLIVINNVSVGDINSIGPPEDILVTEKGIAARVGGLIDIL